MRLVFMGTPAFAVSVLKKLIQHHEVILVVTQPDKPVGRHKTMTPSSVKNCAIEVGLPLFQPMNLRQDYQYIIDLKPDYIITAAYGQMLPNTLLDMIPAINVHGSLLPKYRGGAPIQYALFDGLEENGVTIMHMAYKMDSGDIIAQKTLEIDQVDDYASLSKRLSELGAEMLIDVLKSVELGYASRIPQDPSKVTFAYTLKPEDEKIRFDKTSDWIINRLRGLSPEPGGFAYFHGQKIKFYQAQKSDIIDIKAKPGTVLRSKGYLTIKTSEGAIDMLIVQIPGKKRMPIKDFLNGQTMIKDGDVFEEGKD